MRRDVLAFVWLVAAWQALWRDPSVANVVGGALVAAALLALFPFPDAPGGLRPRPVAMLRLLWVFTTSVIKANLVVAWEVITPGSRVAEGIIGVELGHDHPMVTTVVNHAVNLSPGTFVVDVEDDPTVLYVHALHLDDPDELRAEVRRLGDLVVEAFGLERPVRSTRRR